MRKGTLEWKAPQVHRAPREKLAHALPHVRLSRVQRDHKVSLGQQEAEASQGLRVMSDPKVVKVLKGTWVHPVTLG